MIGKFFLEESINQYSSRTWLMAALCQDIFKKHHATDSTIAGIISHAIYFKLEEAGYVLKEYESSGAEMLPPGTPIDGCGHRVCLETLRFDKDGFSNRIYLHITNK